MKKIILPVLICIASVGNAQHSKISPPIEKARPSGFVKSEELSVTLAGFVDPKNIKSNWKFKLSNKAVRHGSPNGAALDSIKAAKRDIKWTAKSAVDGQKESGANSAVVNPEVGINFLGNEMYDGTPPDNTMAISNGGKIVSVDNATIEIYDAYASDPYLSIYVNHYDFFDFLSPAPTGLIYDPKVIYDSGADRFIYCILHGNSSSQSEILLGFSQTNNPMDGWWVYRIQANQGHPTLWFDYPNIGVSNNEVYITGNMFTNGGSFDGNVVFQIGKNNGYNGQNISWQYWSDLIDDDPNDPRKASTLVPLSWGQQGNYGPGIYLVTHEYPPSADEVWLYDLTNDMTASNEQMVYYEASTTPYEIAAEAQQFGNSDWLNNGDTRIQNGFYLNGTAHFVFASDIGNGWNGINYNRLSTSNLQNSSSTYGLQGQFDYCYPSVASFATDANDKSVMIGFLRSSASIYPEVRVVNCDNNMQWSGSTQVKAGESYVNIVSGTERWGDYSGISRKHNASNPEIWMAGCYGVASNNNGAENGYNAWIAQITGINVPVSIESQSPETAKGVYPNPMWDRFTCEFTLNEKKWINVSLFDMTGRIVKEFFSSTAKGGLNQLEFNRGELPSGSYQLVIRDSKTAIFNETIIIR
jgi:hypothetical protein